MHDRVQHGELFRITEDQRGEATAVDAALFIQNLAAEFTDDGRVGFAIRCQRTVAQLVGVNQVRAQFFERLSDE